MSKHHRPPSARDNRANQLNPIHPAYHRSRGLSPSEAADAAAHPKTVLDNRANQLNPNNAAFEKSRGVNGQPGSSSNASSAKAE